MKPLLLVNGRPLVRHAADHALDWGALIRTVVVAPDNAKAVVQVLPPVDFHFVVQPEPAGLVDAIRRAVPFMTPFTWTLVLCADNTFDAAAAHAVPRPFNTPLIGARLRGNIDADLRFTRWAMWSVDVTTMSDEKTVWESAGGIELFRDQDRTHAYDGVWIGPLLLRTADLWNALLEYRNDVPLEEVIMKATRGGQDLRPVVMDCNDFGVPEEL